MSFRTGLSVATCALGATVFTANSAQAAVMLDFDVASEYDNNFRETAGASALGWDANGYVVRSGSGTSAAMYDANAAAEGKSTFDVQEIRADFRFTTGSSSFGFYTHVPTASETSGYFAYVGVGSNTNSNDLLRLYEGANASTGGVGTQLIETANLNPMSLDTWYTLVFTISPAFGGALDLNLSVFSIGANPTSIYSTSFIDTTPYASPGQIGFRAAGSSGSTISIDNLVVTVPEPASAAFLVGGALLTMGRRRRSRA